MKKYFILATSIFIIFIIFQNCGDLSPSTPSDHSSFKRVYDEEPVDGDGDGSGDSSDDGDGSGDSSDDGDGSGDSSDDGDGSGDSSDDGSDDEDPPVVPKDCDSVALSGKVIEWGNFWYGDFPGPSYENVTYTVVEKNGYFAIKFDTAGFVDDGKITALENAATPGLRLGSISQCPGDFDVSAECKYTWGLGGGLRWSTNGKNGSCQLSSNSIYYFNITFTDGVDPSSSNCNSAPCWVNLQHVNF